MNTHFLHKTVAAKNINNQIKHLISSTGECLNSFSDIFKEIVAFYEKLLGFKDENVLGCPILRDLLSPIAQSAAELLIRPVSREEIKVSMFSIDGGKAAGPDGFTFEFFKICMAHSW